MLENSFGFRKVRRLIWLVLTIFVLLGYSLQNAAGSVYYPLSLQPNTTVTTPPVILQAGTAGTSTIYTNNTSARVNVAAPVATYDFVDNNVSDEDSSSDKGTHSNFTTQKYCDSIYDTLTEANTGLQSSTYSASSVTTVVGSEVSGSYTNLTSDDESYMVWDSGTYAESGSPYLAIMVTPLEKGTQMWYIWTIVNPTDDIYNVTEVRFNTTDGTDMVWSTITPEYPASGWADGGTAGLYWSSVSGEIIAPHDHKRFACHVTTDGNAKVVYTAIWSFIANGTGYSREAWTYEGDRVSQGGIFWNLADDTTEQTVANTQTYGDYLNATVDTGVTELQPNTEYSFLMNLAEWGGQTNGWDTGGTMIITIPKEFTDVELITITEFSDAVLTGGGAENWTITGTNDGYVDASVASLVFNATTPAYYVSQSNWVLDANYTGYCTKNLVDIEVHGEYVIRIATDTNQGVEYTATQRVTESYATIVNITLTYNSKYNVSSGTQSLYAYNYDEGAYDLINQTTPQTSDFNVIYVLLNKSYVDSSDGDILFKLLTTHTSPFNHSGDFLKWDVAYWSTTVVSEAPDGATVYNGTVQSGSYSSLASNDGTDYVISDGAMISESNGVWLAVQTGPIEKGTEGWHSWVVVNSKDTTVTCTAVAFDEVTTPDTDWGWTLTTKVPADTWSDDGADGVSWSGSVDIPAHSAKVWKLFVETATSGDDTPLTFNWTATVTDETVETVQTTIVTQDRISWGGIFWNLPDDTSDYDEADVLASQGNHTYMHETYDGNPIYGETEYLFKFSVQEWGGQTNGFDIGGTLQIIIPKEFTEVTLNTYDDFPDASVSGGGAVDWNITGSNDAYIDNSYKTISFNAKPPSTYGGYSDWMINATFAGYCTKDLCDIWLYGQAVVRVSGPYHKIAWKGYVTTSETVDDILNIELAYDGSYNVSTVKQVLRAWNQTGNSWYEWNSSTVDTTDVLCTVDLYSLNYSHFINSTGVMEIMVNSIYYTDAPLQIEADFLQWNLTVKTGVNYELDLEVQWTTADYDGTNEYLCIYAGVMDAEDLKVDVRNTTASCWDNLFTNLTANSWNNISVSDYLTSATFTIRFKGGTETGDADQDGWNIDATLLHLWAEYYGDYVLRVNNTVTDSWQIRLKKYSDSNISRLQNCTIYFHNSTDGVSGQIYIENGDYKEDGEEGPRYNLLSSETIYIAMTVETNSTATSHVRIYLEIFTPDTTTYAQYLITFEIT